MVVSIHLVIILISLFAHLKFYSQKKYWWNVPLECCSQRCSLWFQWLPPLWQVMTSLARSPTPSFQPITKWWVSLIKFIWKIASLLLQLSSCWNLLNWLSKEFSRTLVKMKMNFYKVRIYSVSLNSWSV